MKEELKKNLENLLKKNFNTVKVTCLEYLSGGSSNETWKFQISSGSNKEDFILRRSFGSSSPLAILKSEEAEIQRLVYKEGAPVPEIIAVADKDSPLGDAYIMKYVDGETIARKILRDEKYKLVRKNLAFECGAAIAKIHKVPIKKVKGLQNKSAKDLIDQLHDTYKSFQHPLPVFEYTFKWLKEQDFGSQRYNLVHGDFRLGNIIVDEHGLRAVIDWELAHIGNPIQDLGWICVNSWRFGQSENIVGGFGQIKDLLKGYSSISKNDITNEQIKTWQIFGTLRWGVICLIQTFAHLIGENNSVERAAIGRRVSETEIDLVDMLFLGGN